MFVLMHNYLQSFVFSQTQFCVWLNIQVHFVFLNFETVLKGKVVFQFTVVNIRFLATKLIQNWVTWRHISHKIIHLYKLKVNNFLQIFFKNDHL